MLESAFNYALKHPVKAVSAILSEPVEAWTAFRERFSAQRERPVPDDLYPADSDWERRLHDRLGIGWPCAATPEFWTLWPAVIAEMESRGIRPGPESFKAWNDGDAGFVRAIWCLTRHLKPDNVVETGVAHGVTSRFILEALERNRNGRLFSIDHPPIEDVWHDQIGIAVGGRHAERWSYISGSSRRRLPPLLARLGRIDLFVHDSLHSEQNVRFEMDSAFAALRPGGALVVDDIDANWGFKTFTETCAGFDSAICEAEPIHPDLRRFNHKGLFGTILKKPAAVD